MPLRKLEGLLQRLLREAAEGHGFLLTCAGLALAGTLTAAYPVVAVVVPAALLVPRRWLRIAAFAAFGSALGATLLVIAFHDVGWAQLYARFPELETHAAWAKVMVWVEEYGAAALFLVAVTPLPQTPALIVFGIAHHDRISVFVAMLAGKLIKYGLLAWLAARFPERFSNGIAGWLRWRRGKGEGR